MGQTGDVRKDALSSEEASQQRLRESIELSKELIEQSNRLMRRERGSGEGKPLQS